MLESNKSVLDPIKSDINKLNLKLEPIALKQEQLKNLIENDQKDIISKEYKLQDERSTFEQQKET